MSMPVPDIAVGRQEIWPLAFPFPLVARPAAAKRERGRMTAFELLAARIIGEGAAAILLMNPVVAGVTRRRRSG